MLENCTFTPLRGNRYRVNPGGPVLKKAQLAAYRVTLCNRYRPALLPLTPVVRPTPAWSRSWPSREPRLAEEAPYSPPPQNRRSNAAQRYSLTLGDMDGSFRCPACRQGISFLDEEGDAECSCGAVTTLIRQRTERRPWWE